MIRSSFAANFCLKISSSCTEKLQRLENDSWELPHVEGWETSPIMAKLLHACLSILKSHAQEIPVMYDAKIAPTNNSSHMTSQNIRVIPKDRGHYVLEISGSFKPGWLARLAMGLSELQINILRGKGNRVSGLRWDAEFELMTSTDTGFESIDFRALIERESPNRNIGSLELSYFSFQPDHSSTHCIWVELQGPDKLGFLQNVLKTFALYSLFPSKLEINTDGNLALDRFLLTGIAGATPSKSALEGLEQTLRSLMKAA